MSAKIADDLLALQRLYDWEKKAPTRVALTQPMGGGVVHDFTWAQVADQTRRMAAHLQAQGWAPGSKVAILSKNCAWWMMSDLAIWMAGYVSVPLYPTLAPETIRQILTHSESKALFVGKLDGWEGMKPGVPAGLPCISYPLSPVDAIQAYEGWDAICARTEPLKGHPVRAENDLATLIYTSGTTGLPKGVVLDRKPSADDPITTEYLLDVRSKRQSDRRSAYLLSMPMHHGSGPGQLWSAQRAGALTVLQRRFAPEEALALIAQHRLTHWTGVPTMYKRIAALPPEVVAGHDLGSIEQLTVGAAPVSADLKRWIIAHLGDCLHEGYGSTETGMVTHMPPAMQHAKPGSSGLPYRHVRLEIRDAEGNVLPTGETGEIWAWTPANIRNYLNAPPLDGETLDARGYFRTGDMGHLDADGYLWISDRAKDMVIAGGVNIYPAEIEAALLTHPALSDAAVIGIPDDEMGERVMAFCEPKPGHRVTEDELLAHCTERLASYKRPRAIRIVGELPRNTVGKLLKRELRAPFWQHTDRKV